MLHLVILADAPSPEQSYGGLLITGAVTIVVAVIGYLAAKGRGDRHRPEPNEPQWIKDLRGEAHRLRRENQEKDERLEKLERILMIYRIDPETGGRLPNAVQAFPPRSTPTPEET